jgi:hypothetical protein
VALPPAIRTQIANGFSETEQIVAIEALKSLTLAHVMANSQANLDNAHRAIIELSNGDLGELQHLVEVAKRDFRDVIYWASQHHEN